MEFIEDTTLEYSPELVEGIAINQEPLVSLQSSYIPRIDDGTSIQVENYIEESELFIRVEAEDYTDYLDTTPGNTGGAYRNDDVDLGGSGDIDDGFSVGWINEGEWLTYNIDVPESSSYQVIARIVSELDTNHSLDISIDGQTTTLNFDGTGGWDLWEDARGESIELTAGSHELRLEMGSSGFNLNYIDFISEDNSGTHTYAQEVLEPIPEPIQESDLSIGFQEVVQIPNSGNESNASARLNLLAAPGDGSGRLFVNDMRGKLYVISDGTPSEYMDLASLVGEGFLAQTNQQGFSYFAFHPEFATNGIFYTIHTEDKNTETADFPVIKPIIDQNGDIIESSHHSVVREWDATVPSANTFSGTFREMLRIEQPYADHDLGQLAFNPNANFGDSDYGMLYVGISDGGSDGFPVSNTDPLDVGQDLSNILGSIVRIDPFGNNRRK